MLILGIETATERVSVAIGGHEGVIGLFESTRGRRHAETLVPAIEFLTSQIDIDLDEISVVAVDVGPGLFTGMRVGLASAKAIAQALRIPMIGISSLDLLAFPCRHADRVVVPVIDARKGEVFYAMYRQVPGGVQQVVEPRVGTVEDLIADLLARSQDVLCVGDGALRYREEILDGFHCEIGGDAHPSAAPLVQLAHARALREDWVNPARSNRSTCGHPTPRSTGRRGRRGRERAPMSVIERLLRREGHDPATSWSIDPDAQARPRAGILDIEAVSYPRPWSQGVFESEIEQMKAGSRHYVVARQRREVAGYAGLWFSAGEAHVTNVAARPDLRRGGVATALLLALADEARRRSCSAWTLEVRVSSTGAQELYRRFGFAPAGIRHATTRMSRMRS